jgi:hypothetical protein
MVVSMLATLALLGALGSRAESATIGANGQERTKACEVRLTGYGPVEEVVWKAICAGKTADLRRMPNRTLNPAFLTEILFSKIYREALSYHGVHIVGAIFAGKLDLTDAALDQPLRIEKSRFKVPPDFTHLNALRGLSLSGSSFICGPDGRVSLQSAYVGGHLDLEGTWFACTLDMGHIRVDGALNLNRLVDSKSEHNSEYTNVVLSNSWIREKVSLEGAQITGTLDMVGIQVVSNVVMRDCGDFGTVKLSNAKIGGDLDVTTSTLASLDLTGARVEGEFKIGGGGWTGAAKLNLRHAAVGSVLSTEPAAWPGNMEIVDFTYNRVGGFWGTTDSMVSQFETWLKGQPRQPYEQLGKVLEKEGYLDESADILYAGRQAERSRASGLTWVWLSMQNAFIGYGYRKWWSLWWIAGFVVVGVGVFHTTPEAKAYKMPLGIAYSFDMLLPVIRLREKHYRIDLKRWQRYYFYFHKVMGYVLTSFVIAGLSGLTK